MAVEPSYVRICPVCAAEHDPAASQCTACGTLLLGVDLSLRQPVADIPAVELPAPADPLPAAATAEPRLPAGRGPRCPHADCGAENAPGSAECVYCGRSLQVAPAPAPAGPGLYNLPARLAANFTIERVLPAAGAEAELMLLRGIKTGARVMAKIYRPGILPKGEVLERVSRVAHAHVVRMLAHGMSDGIAYEVMEYCTGGSLRDLMAAGTQPPERIRLVLGEIAEALAALHACQVIHRDLKPENVLVRTTEPLDLVLTDFGISSVQAATQLFTGLARTASYSAPEAMTGVLDAAADYWSLGIILLELLQGRHPFAGLSDAVIAHRLAVGEVELDGVRDRSWQKLCRGLLQRDPKQRWQIAEIRRWLAGDATLPEPAVASASLVAPYVLEGEECRTEAELAIAFSRHWQAARRDFRRGELATWARVELKDHDLVRTLHDIRERGGSEDLQLFRLIRRLAPTIPPVWMGGGVDVRSILATAARAVGDDPDAAEWLHSLYAAHVIEELAESDYPDLRTLASEWQHMVSEFDRLWREVGGALDAWRREERARGDVVVDIDALMYGIGGDLQTPGAGRIHAELLMALRAPAAVAEQRPLLLAEAARHADHSPWLAPILQRAAETGEAGAIALVALRHLLPQAREASAVGQRRLVDRAEHVEGRLSELLNEGSRHLVEIRTLVDTLPLVATGARERLAAALDGFMAVSYEARGLVGGGATSPALRGLAAAEPVVLAMRNRLDDWESGPRLAALWTNQRLLQAGATGFFLVLAVAPRWLPVLLVPLLGAWAWRTWMVSLHRRDVRALARRLPLRLTPAAEPAT
jgi:hypothetical protein